MKALRALLLIAGYVALLAGGMAAGSWLSGLAAHDLAPAPWPRAHRMVLLAAALYALATALPFVPGAEIGMALLMTLGAGVAPLVYGSTVAALMLAYLVGRLVPTRVTAAGLGAMRLHRARSLLLQLEALDTRSRLELLSASAPRRWVPFLLRHRYLMLALVINVPGNSLVGGGGGIALAAGLSGLYSPAAFLATVGIAVAPVPIVFVLSGALP